VHSKPVIVTYGTKKRIYVGTNEGFLHSFDDQGVEQFAFMPKTLLKNIDVQYRNDSADKHVSGVDGEITTWLIDSNHDGQWTIGEKVILFFGLRRGGSAYYALDVSDPEAAPKVLWRIDPSMTGFSQLAQTWSTPVLTQLRYGGNPADEKLKPVLIFGGGYNPRIDEEDKSARSAASTANIGTTVFIVDALGKGDGTTELLWKADHSEMKYSIPSTIRALDMDRNGSVDRLYFGDMGGNIWRADLDAGKFLSTPSLYDLSKAKVTKLAALGDNTGTDLRKFFAEPDVAFFRHNGRFLLTVAIGSGYRAHPLNENIVDRFYVLRDQYALRTPDASFQTITETGSSQPLIAPVDKTKNLLDNDYFGWYRELNAINHEKVLARTTTFLNRVSFTSFGKTAPKVVEEGSCDIVTNFQSRAYVLDLLRGNAVIDFDTAKTGNEASIKVSDDEIVATPQIIFGKVKPTSGTTCTKDNCHQSISLRAGKLDRPIVDDSTGGGNVDITTLLPKVFWREEEK
jgi:Tfp pilus tip-associated adhesin PilY1